MLRIVYKNLLFRCGATDIFVVMQEGRELMVPFVTKIFYKVDIKNKKLFAYLNLYNEAAV